MLERGNIRTKKSSPGGEPRRIYAVLGGTAWRGVAVLEYVSESLATVPVAGYAARAARFA
jgi:hypothetical protein